MSTKKRQQTDTFETQAVLPADPDSDLILLNVLYPEPFVLEGDAAKDGETVGDAQYLKNLAIAA